MFTLRQLIGTSGFKKEYLINRSQINRSKFYKALRNPSILNLDEVDRLAMAMRLERKELLEIINAKQKTPGPDN